MTPEERASEVFKDHILGELDERSHAGDDARIQEAISEAIREAVEAEREECAKACEAFLAPARRTGRGPWNIKWVDECIEAIRSRGKETPGGK